MATRIHQKYQHTGIWTYTWEDLRFPAQAINPPGAASDPDVDSTTGLLLFDAAGTELVFGVAQLPHSWCEGTAIVPHVHWQKTTSAAGDVLWRLEYEVAGAGDVSPLTYASQVDVTSAVSATPDNDTAGENLISSFGEVDMTGKNVSCLLFWKLSRIGGDASDTYGADALMVEFDIHFQKDSPGSDGQFTKSYESP